MTDVLMAIDRIAFYLPFINKPVYWYGIFVTLGILLAFGLYMLISVKKGIDVDFSLELFIWVVPLAVIFCRVFYVVPRIGTEYHLDSLEGLWEMINISNGGLTIIGGIFGGALGIFFCCLRNRKYTLAQVADCVVIALLLGQIIGRWGNFFNQELYGIEVTQDWLKHFPLAVYIEETGAWHYASFFYEGVLNAIGLAIALVIFFVPKKPVKTGTIMIFYLGWYGFVRGTLEFIKGTDPITIGGTKIKAVQLICYIMFIVAIVLQILLQKGVIRFETKWFKRLCEKKREKELALEQAKLAQENGEQLGENNIDDAQAESESNVITDNSVVLEESELQTNVDEMNTDVAESQTESVEEPTEDIQVIEVKPEEVQADAQNNSEEVQISETTENVVAQTVENKPSKSAKTTTKTSSSRAKTTAKKTTSSTKTSTAKKSTKTSTNNNTGAKKSTTATKKSSTSKKTVTKSTDNK